MQNLDQDQAAALLILLDNIHTEALNSIQEATSTLQFLKDISEKIQKLIGKLNNLESLITMNATGDECQKELEHVQEVKQLVYELQESVNDYAKHINEVRDLALKTQHFVEVQINQ